VRAREDRVPEHAKGVLPGGLDGASAVPAPVGPRPEDASADCDTVIGKQAIPWTSDGGGTVAVPLLPADGSAMISVHLCRPARGPTLLEGIHWTRSGAALQILPEAGARAGDVLVVHHMHCLRSGAPVLPPETVVDCSPAYPLIEMERSVPVPPPVSTGSATRWPNFAGFPYIPEARGPAYDDGGIAWAAINRIGGGTANQSNLVGSTSAGAPLVTGSLRSRGFTVTSGDYRYNHVKGSTLSIHAGDHAPRWGEASYVAMEGSYSITSATPGIDNNLNRPSSTIAALTMAMAWRDPASGTSGTRSVDITLAYRHNTEADGSGPYYWVLFPSTSMQTLLGAWNHRSPWEPGVHRTSLHYDVAARELRVSFDDLTYTCTQDLWFSEEDIRQSTSGTPGTLPRFKSVLGDLWFSSAPTGTGPVTMCFDGHKVSSDVPYCRW
jgi:hypothetical protein